MNSGFKRVTLLLVLSTVFILLATLQRDWIDRILATDTQTLNQDISRFETSRSHMKKLQEIYNKYGIRRNMSLNCRKLFRIAKDNFHKHRSFPKTNTEPKEYFLEVLIKDCPRLISEHGYDDKPVTRLEQEFPLAFSVKIHTNAHQAERLLRTIYRPHNFYCIHIDSKASDETFNLIKGVVNCLRNVAILPERLNVVESSIRLVMVEFACMKLSVQSGVQWRYYINLDEQEFMLRTTLELVTILKIFNGANDIEAYPLNQLSRIKEKFLINDNTVVSNGTNTLFKYNIDFYKGSPHGMFSREFVDFVLTDDFVSEFYEWLNTTYAPAEIIWSTLNVLPFTPGGSLASDTEHALRAVIRGTDHRKCHGKFVRGICVFNSGDLPWLYSRPEIVANTFDEDIDSVVLDCLEGWANERTYSVNLRELDFYYYKNLTQVNYTKRLFRFRKRNEHFQREKINWLKRYGPQQNWERV